MQIYIDGIVYFWNYAYLIILWWNEKRIKYVVRILLWKYKKNNVRNFLEDGSFKISHIKKL